MKVQLITALVALGALAGCDSNRQNVQEAQKDLTETRQEAAKDVSEAQGEAVNDVNAAKEDAAADIKDAQKDVQEAKKDLAQEGAGSASGATSPASGEVKVTKEQCATFATNKKITPENQALYDACAKLDPEKFGK